MNRAPEFNARVLVIDDEESIRDSFCQALRPDTGRAAAELDAAAARLFGDEPARRPEASLYAGIGFEVDVAASGREGFAQVERAVADGRPYAVIFTDMRMPGWNGRETAEHIRELDPRCEIVFVTAYAGQDVASLVASVGANIGYFLKPFATDEIRQMAVKAVVDWNKAREMERLLGALASLDGEVGSVEELLQYLLGQICSWLGTDSGVLAELDESGRLRFRIGRGELGSQADIDALVADANAAAAPVIRGDRVILPIDDFGVAVALRGSAMLTPERMYLIQVFLKYAALAIRNSESRAALRLSRRLSAMGEALGFVVHDIRGPLATALMLLGSLASGIDHVYPKEELVALLRRSLEQASALVTDVLDFSRGSLTVQPQEVALDEALAQPLRLVAFEMEQRELPLEIDIPPGITARVDADALVRALRNLAINAAEALVGHEAPQVWIDAAADADGVRFRVVDNGPGIPAQIESRLFEPFASAGKRGGTGLGLAVVKLIVEAHGGTVAVIRDGDRTCFELRLP